MYLLLVGLVLWFGKDLSIQEGPSIPEAQKEEQWIKRIEERIEKISKEKNKENSDKIMEKLDSKFERAERQARRQNLIIKGMAFNPVNLVRGVEEFFEQKLETKVRVKKAVKLNRGSGGDDINSEGNVLVCLESLDDKKSIMRKRGLLKGSRVYVDDDLTKKERVIHKEIWEHAKEHIEKGSRVKRGYMKLIIDGTCWRWNEWRNKLENPNFRKWVEESQLNWMQ